MGKIKSIVIVDDDVDASELARMMLAMKGGFEVGVCNRPTNALAMIREWKPDLILLDVVMPEMDGTEIAEMLRKDPELCSIPVIFMTSLMTPQEAAANPTFSKYRFIPKPVKAEELLERVKAFFKFGA